MATHEEQIIAASAKHPIVPVENGYQYGTAGFRMKADLLDGITFRVGLLASLRSRKVDSQTVGVMITASHNPAQDNGVKIVDPTGDMLEQSWEKFATQLVNAKSDQELAQRYTALAKENKIDLDVPARVIYGRDTRPSGHTLVAALNAALDATNTTYVDYKILTTPQLHYLVRATNTEGRPDSYGEVSEAGYYKKLSDAFVRCMKHKKVDGPLVVDCANGVGGPKLSEFLKYIPKDKVDFDVQVVNDNIIRPELLNLDCGADFVKTKQRAPPVPKPEVGVRHCSLDGDADRLIYWWLDPELAERGGFVMLDGDRISTLAAQFIKDLMDRAGLNKQEDDRQKLRIGVVQTAYANGASTKHIKQYLKLPVVCTPTGVKHLHHAARDFDIGVYFEANGHGTVLFSHQALSTFKDTQPQSPAQKDALDTLLALSDLINQTVGDAISDMLLVEVILAHKVWSLRDWVMTYSDLPNRLFRVEVANKDLFRTTDAERRLSHPEGCQQEIDIEVKKYTDARAFARASGTENAMRVYAEAATRMEADELCDRVAHIIHRWGA